MANLSLQQHIDYPDSELIRVLKERDQKGKAERSSTITIYAGVFFPEELIIEILSWLPVKTLLQFKCVSKLWYAIIISHSFISKHLRNYYDNNQPGRDYCFLTLEHVTQACEVDFRARFVDETLQIYANSEIKEPPLQHFDICGPCNGIYFLYGKWERGILWNPTINDVKVLPSLVMNPDLPDCAAYWGDETYGFGYDPLTEDYKVVYIKEYKPKDGLPKCKHPPSLIVYSLKSDSWRYWGDLPQFYDKVLNNNTQIFVKGCLYWIGERYWDDKYAAIISFNIVTNVLEEIEMPKYEKESTTSLGIYKDFVALFTTCWHRDINPNTTHSGYYDPEIYRHCLDMWTFNEGCWTKKFTTGPIQPFMYIFGHLKDNTVLLKYGSDLVLCDPDTEEMWDIINMGTVNRGFQSVVVYRESLVSINRLSTQAYYNT